MNSDNQNIVSLKILVLIYIFFTFSINYYLLYLRIWYFSYMYNAIICDIKFFVRLEILQTIFFNIIDYALNAKIL